MFKSHHDMVPFLKSAHIYIEALSWTLQLVGSVVLAAQQSVIYRSSELDLAVGK